MKIINLVALVLCTFVLSGCFLTKVVTVPLRLGAAVVSIVPVAGEVTHDAIDKAAEIIDEVPL